MPQRSILQQDNDKACSICLLRAPQYDWAPVAHTSDLVIHVFVILGFLPSPSYSPYSCFLESPPTSLGRRGGSKLRRGHVCYTYFLKSLKAMNIKVRKVITSWQRLRAEELGDRDSTRWISRGLANILSRPDCGSTCVINHGAVRFVFCTFRLYFVIQKFNNSWAWR